MSKDNQVCILSTANAHMELTPGRPTMIWRLGSAQHAWLPGESHFRAVREFVEKSGLTREYNVFLCHFGVSVEVIDSRPWWRRLRFWR